MNCIVSWTTQIIYNCAELIYLQIVFNCEYLCQCLLNKIICWKGPLLEIIKTGWFFNHVFVLFFFVTFFSQYSYFSNWKLCNLFQHFFLFCFSVTDFLCFPFSTDTCLYKYAINIMTIFSSLTHLLFAFWNFLPPLIEMQVFFFNQLPLTLPLASSNETFSSNWKHIILCHLKTSHFILYPVVFQFFLSLLNTLSNCSYWVSFGQWYLLASQKQILYLVL